MQNSEMFRQRATDTGFDTLAPSHSLSSLSFLLFSMLSLSIFVFFFFSPTLLCLIIHLYDAVDTYVRELFPECNHARVCNYYERKLSQVRLSSLLPLPSSFSARIFLSFFSVFFFLVFHLFQSKDHP